LVASIVIVVLAGCLALGLVGMILVETRAAPAAMPPTRLGRLLGPEPNSVLKATLIALILVGFAETWRQLYLHYLHSATVIGSAAQQRHVTALGRDIPFTIFRAIAIPALAETLILGLIAIPFRHFDQRYWFVVLAAILAAVAHQPMSVARTIPIGIVFAVMSLELDIWMERRSWKLAYAGTAWTHAVYNGSLISLSVIDWH
jgi:hypothetical protein